MIKQWSKNLHRPSCLLPKILHNHCFQFLLCITVVPREIGDNGYGKFWGVNKENYGLAYVKMVNWAIAFSIRIPLENNF